MGRSKRKLRIDAPHARDHVPPAGPRTGLQRKLRNAAVWGLTAVLMVGAAAATFLAWTLYPTGSVPSRPSPVYVSVGSASPLQGVQVTISQPLGTDFYEIDVRGISSERATNATSPATVWVALPGGLVLPDAQSSVHCSPSCTALGNEFGQGVDLLRFRVELQPRWSVAEAGSTFASWVRIPISRFGLDGGGIKNPQILLPGMICSDMSCRGSVPVVTATETTQIMDGAYSYARFADVDLSYFEWSSLLTPYAHVEPGLLFNYPLDKESDSHFLAQYPADGENTAFHRSEQLRLFLSGAVIALAGALLIAAMQEAASTLRGHPAQGFTGGTRRRP